MWIRSQIADFGADVGSPACFCCEHFVLDMFVETLKLGTHGVDNGGGEISGGAESMQKLISFLDGRVKLISVELKPIIAFRANTEGCLFTYFFDGIIKCFIRHR